MKIVQIATAVEHYKNGEVYTDLYGIDEEGNPHILVGNEWNLLTITTSEGERGAEIVPRPSEISFDSEVIKEIFADVRPKPSQIKSLEKLCKAYYEHGRKNR